MLQQAQIQNAVKALTEALSDAWSTASMYEAHLTSAQGEPEVYEISLLREITALYVRTAFLLEALNLPSLLAEFNQGFAKFRGEKHVNLKVDGYGNTYPSALEYLDTFVSPIAAATLPLSEVLPGNFLQLERILEGTPKILYDRKITPTSEADVRREIFNILIHVFPGTVREVPIAQVSKTYRPDIGVRSLKAAIEYKYANTLSRVKQALGGIYEDIHGYQGSTDWTTFYAVIYMTEPFLTRFQVEDEWKMTGVPHIWKPILVTGKGSNVESKQPVPVNKLGYSGDS